MRRSCWILPDPPVWCLNSWKAATRRAFWTIVKTQSAVLHQLLVMGEAVKRLSMDYRGHHSEVPWNLIAGMRDQLIHGYDIVDLHEVWKTATQDVPDLLAWLEPRLPEEA